MRRISSERAKACQIPQKVKAAVYYRDNGRCILCGSNRGSPEAHFIPRSKGGMGIEENIMTLCRECHDLFDHGAKDIRELMRIQARRYLQCQYPDWNEDKLYWINRGKTK